MLYYFYQNNPKNFIKNSKVSRESFNASTIPYRCHSVKKCPNGLALLG